MEQPAGPVAATLWDMDAGLKPADRVILTAFIQAGGTLGYKDLLSATGLCRRQLSHLCKMLEQRGYIRRVYGADAKGIPRPARLELVSATAPTPPPAATPCTAKPDCGEPARFLVYHQNGRAYAVCNPCGAALAIPADKRHKLDGAAGF